jgi:hypothetical protein
MPTRRIMLEMLSALGIRCDARPASPVAVPTADSAKRIGTPAATMAPKATSRITSVTGRL